MKSTQTIVIFGANGKVGRLLVEYALADGYRVTAFVHSHHDLPTDRKLRIVTGDVYNAADVSKALKGADAVMSALSSWGTPKKDVLASGMKSITTAMQKQKIKRIISLTGADARAAGDTYSIVHKMTHKLFTIVAAGVLEDGEKHIRVLADSKLDWTVVRSPAMLPGKNDSYELSYKRPLPIVFVRRRAVARAMIEQLNDTTYSRQAPYIR